MSVRISGSVLRPLRVPSRRIDPAEEGGQEVLPGHAAAGQLPERQRLSLARRNHAAPPILPVCRDDPEGGARYAELVRREDLHLDPRCPDGQRRGRSEVVAEQNAYGRKIFIGLTRKAYNLTGDEIVRNAAVFRGVALDSGSCRRTRSGSGGGRGLMRPTAIQGRDIRIRSAKCHCKFAFLEADDEAIEPVLIRSAQIVQREAGRLQERGE